MEGKTSGDGGGGYGGMTTLEETKSAEVDIVLRHIELELATALDAKTLAFMLRRIKPLVGLAFDAGYEANRRKQADS